MRRLFTALNVSSTFSSRNEDRGDVIVENLVSHDILNALEVSGGLIGPCVGNVDEADAD